MRNLQELIKDRALFAVSHSGGKDSMATLEAVVVEVPREQIVVVHASLGELEWPGALEKAREHAQHYGLPFIVARAVWIDGSEKTLFGMVENRFATRPEVPSWPSSQQRQCTSDLKRTPIDRELRRYAKAHGYTKVVQCLGLRADESTDRRNKPVWSELDRFKNKKTGKWAAGREWYQWLPIHAYTTEDVWSTIRESGVEPHYAYGLGNERLSCVFCIMSSPNDMCVGAKANPELADKYRELEAKTGYTMHQSRRSFDEMLAA